MYYIFFIHASADGHLDYFHVLVIINSAAVNIGMHVPFGIMVLSECILEKEMASHSSILAWRIPWATVHGITESDMTERLTLSLSLSGIYMPSSGIAGSCCCVASVVSDSVRPHRQQPTRLPVPGILQARTLEWVAISFSNA